MAPPPVWEVHLLLGPLDMVPRGTPEVQDLLAMAHMALAFLAFPCHRLKDKATQGILHWDKEWHSDTA